MMSRIAVVVVVGLGLRPGAFAQQVIDPDFDPKVERPAYTDSDRHPSVLFDEAHNNFHTTDGRFKPFVGLIANDGYLVTPGTKKFSKETLQGHDVLVIANAQGARSDQRVNNPERAAPAFEASECDAVREWVEAGGALLLIAKQYPWGSATVGLAARLGVEMDLSYMSDRLNREPGMKLELMVFSRENGLLGEHPILNGRDASERVDSVLTFNGQSLQGPSGAVMLMKFSDTAVARPVDGKTGRKGPAAGRAQGLAFPLGKGRVVVLGEAAMLTAQLFGPEREPFGLNLPACDNRQLALNIMHWLTAVKMLDTADLAARPVRPRNAGAEAAKPADPGRPLPPDRIAEESEQSVALVSSPYGAGTGFLVGPGLLMTNSHVLNGAYLSDVKIRFPSARKGQQGPFSAELVFEDSRRDLALLAVKSTLPPLRIAPNYTFRKGEEVVVIGNPGLGTEGVLENAISRGIMSTRKSLKDLQFYQLSIAVNPGNSGGPVFDSTGAVIGVITLNFPGKQALAFCIPIEDVQVAIKKAETLAPDTIDRIRSKHRLVLAVRQLSLGGALYSSGIALHRLPKAGPEGKDIPKDKQAPQLFQAVTSFETNILSRLRAAVARIRKDALVTDVQRDRVARLEDNLDKYKALYADKGVASDPDDPFPALNATHRRLTIELCEALTIARPGYMGVFDRAPADRGTDGKKHEEPADKE
jgi:S1-C subfamily serine protease